MIRFTGVVARFWAGALLLATAFSVQAQMHKCQDEKGKITYSEIPCPPSGAALKAPDMTNSARLSGPSYGSSNLDTRPLPPINFGSTPELRFAKSKAMVESVKIDARGCDWDLKVTKKADRCAKFLQQMLPGREWEQATGVLTELVKDDQWLQHNVAGVQSVTQDMKEVLQIKELAVLRAR